MTPVEKRAIWLATCVFWAWSWGVAALCWAPFTLGLSLLLLAPAGGSVALMWAPVGKPPQVPPTAYPAQWPTYGR